MNRNWNILAEQESDPFVDSPSRDSFAGPSTFGAQFDNENQYAPILGLSNISHLQSTYTLTLDEMGMQAFNGNFQTVQDNDVRASVPGYGLNHAGISPSTLSAQSIFTGHGHDGPADFTQYPISNGGWRGYPQGSGVSSTEADQRPTVTGGQHYMDSEYPVYQQLNPLCNMAPAEGYCEHGIDE